LVSIILASIVSLDIILDEERIYAPHWFGLFAVVTGFLWLKLLSFLKVMNPTLATFVLAISQILKDVLLLLLILAISMIAFADMFYLLSKSDVTTCPPDQDPQDANPYCSPIRYLDIFVQILGQFDYGSFLDHPLTIGLFIIMTLFGAVIFLNILIAVVSDSYSTSCQKSTRLFGRARLLTVAKINALEEIMQPKYCNRKDTQLVRVAKLLFKLLSLGCCSFAMFLFTRLLIFINGNNPSSAGAVFASFLLFLFYIGTLLLTSILIIGWGQNRKFPKCKILNGNIFVTWIFFRPMVFIVYVVMGQVSIVSFHKKENNEEKIDEWSEKMKQIDSTMRESIERTESHLSEVIDSLNTRVKGYEEESAREIGDLKESLASQNRQIIEQRVLLENILEKMTVVEQARNKPFFQT